MPGYGHKLNMGWPRAYGRPRKVA